MAASLAEQIAEVRRELAMRARVYPGLIARGRMTADEAATNAQRMEAALATLEWLERHRTTVLALGREAMALESTPALAAVLDTFPGAVVTTVRET